MKASMLKSSVHSICTLQVWHCDWFHYETEHRSHTASHTTILFEQVLLNTIGIPPVL